ncbi:hypothetical protein ACFSTI_09885 [Rhizorhabdus histidinilytica]
MLRILCVDDDGLVLSITSDLLRALGHEVVEAIGGAPRRGRSRKATDSTCSSPTSICPAAPVARTLPGSRAGPIPKCR